MVLGISTKNLKKPVPEDPTLRDQRIVKKINALANAVRIPAPINQFKTTLENTDETRLIKLLSKYKPETRAQRISRISSEDPKAGPKPILIKFGMKHVVDLIERKKAKLVVIAADVAPITVVVFLPTLCKKMGIPYAIVKSKSSLGNLVNLKSAAAVCIEDCKPEDSAEFNEVVRIANAVFADQYEKHMNTVGGGKFSKKITGAN